MVTAEPAYLEHSSPRTTRPRSPDDSGGDQGFSSEDNQSNNLEPISLETNRSTSTSTSTSSAPSSAITTSQSDPINYDDDDDDDDEPIKCSAVHALERDMPDHDYSHLVKQLRDCILENIAENQGLYSQKDIDRCRHDDWFLSRFLLRHKLDFDLAYDQLKRTMRFNNESLMSVIRPEDFPAEFYQLGGVFSYEPDRKGNRMMYMRVKIHRKTPEIISVIQAFLHFNTTKCDQEAHGRGMSVVIDCTGAGLQNADMDLLFFFISTLRNYFPKGLSYILVHNLPWILKPFWHIAKMWVPDEHKELIKFSNDRTIFEYVNKKNLPDFMGGTCKRDYRAAPANCTNLVEAAKLWGVDKKTARKILAKFEDNLPAETVKRCKRLLANGDEDDDGYVVDDEFQDALAVHGDTN